jgi:hypothetical protein
MAHQVTPDQRLRSADKEHQEKMRKLKQSILDVLDEDPFNVGVGVGKFMEKLERIRKIVEN